MYELHVNYGAIINVTMNAEMGAAPRQSDIEKFFTERGITISMPGQKDGLFVVEVDLKKQHRP